MSNNNDLMIGRPSKPPRGHKMTSSTTSSSSSSAGGGGGRETGILMRVIKTLSVAASTDHRDREKTKLEKDFRKSDTALDALLATHQPALSSVMQLFSSVCTEITASKENIRSVKTNLQQCKSLLQCRREELQRLWLEGIEHKHAIEIFDQIEQLQEGSDNFTKLLNRKQYIPAVEVLMKCLQSWKTHPYLDKIEGLRDLHAELKMKRDKIYETLKEELYKRIYHNFGGGSFEKRQGSGGVNQSSFNRGGSDRLSSSKLTGQAGAKARKLLLDFGLGHANNATGAFTKSAESQETDTFIVTIVDCMIRLEEVSKFLKDLRHNLEEKLMEVVNSASQHIIEYGDTTGVNESDIALFQQLVQLLFSQFRSVVRSQCIIIRHLESPSSVDSVSGMSSPNRPNYKLHNEEYLWSKIQSVLQSTLKIYFGLSDAKSDESSMSVGGSDYIDQNLSINSYFVKRRTQRPKRPLFKFKYSLHGLNINDYVVQGSDDKRVVVDRHRFLVCKPRARNIITIYGTVQELCNEIEQSNSSGHKCELRKFMNNNINKVFVQQLYKEIADAVDVAKKNPDFWKECISIDEAKTLNCPRPLVQSVVQIGRRVQEVQRLSQELPSHSDQLAKILQATLASYLEACQTAFKSIIHPDVEDKAVISSNWARDSDIQRLLKSLPPWLKLLKAKSYVKALGVNAVNKSISMDDTSPEDNRGENLKESDLLTGLFYGKTVQKREIITDTKQINQLAHLHESVEWFADLVTSVTKSFETSPNFSYELKECTDKVYELGMEFVDLADVCLLVLNLEIRIHCFHFLIPMAQNNDFSPGVDTQNSDSEVLKLVRDLGNIHSVLASSLQPSKCRYVFEGIGQLISTILIGCVEHIQRINDNGVKKMCRNIFAIQKNLSDITHQPEQPMDHARQFYDLFTHSPEELVDGILEKGPEFKESEYTNALKLMFRSKPSGQRMHSLEDHLNRLSNILGDVGVVV